MANIGYTMCCQIDVMMNGYLATLEDRKMQEMETIIKWQAERIKELEAELARRK